MNSYEHEYISKTPYISHVKLTFHLT